MASSRLKDGFKASTAIVCLMALLLGASYEMSFSVAAVSFDDLSGAALFI